MVDPPAEATPPGQESSAWELTVAEVQLPGRGIGLGAFDDKNCVAIQAVVASRVLSTRAVATWSAVGPTATQLHVRMVRAGAQNDGPAEEGASPVAIESPEAFDLAADEHASIYLGAPRSGEVVYDQPVHLDLEVSYVGQLRTYAFACTVGG